MAVEQLEAGGPRRQRWRVFGKMPVGGKWDGVNLEIFSWGGGVALVAAQQTLGILGTGLCQPPALPKEGVARHHPTAAGHPKNQKGGGKEPYAAEGLRGREGPGPTGGAESSR